MSGGMGGIVHENDEDSDGCPEKMLLVWLKFFVLFLFFFFKQKTAYEIGTGDWSSDVCSSDLADDA